MFLDSLGVPGMPETTPFRGFGGPKVVMKAGSMPSETKLYNRGRGRGGGGVPPKWAKM